MTSGELTAEPADDHVVSGASADAGVHSLTPTPSFTTTAAAPASNFPAIDADADVDRLTSLSSLCMHCGEQGETRLLLTSIPYFRDVIIMSFSCLHCHYQHNEVQPASEIQPKARRFTLRVDPSDPAATRRDLDRQLIKSEAARVLIPEIEFEIGPTRTRGDINTIEGVLGNVCDSLSEGQANRALSDVEVFRKVAAVIEDVRAMKEGERAFTFVIDDLSGNSYIENPYAPAPDPRVKMDSYARTPEQTEELGYAQEPARAEDEGKDSAEGQTNSSSRAVSTAMDAGSTGYAVSDAVVGRVETFFNVSDRSATLEGQCHACHRACETRMAVTDIPHFKEVVLMSTACDWCGFRDTECKPAGRVSERAVRVTLRVESVDDLKRDLLKSDSSSISIPEIELEMLPGTLGGKYTTLEGILQDVKAQLGALNPFHMGDSGEAGQRGAFGQFLARLDDCIALRTPFTLVLDDALGNSFIWSDHPEGMDPRMTIERYERTWEQNEELGLNDVNVEPEQYATEEDQVLFQEEMAKEDQVGDAEVERKKNVEERKRQHVGMHEGKVGGKIQVHDD